MSDKNKQKIPKEIKQWISDFCSGKVSVKVGHMMFACDENLQNTTIGYCMYLIRNNQAVAKWMDGDKDRISIVAAYTAQCIQELIIEIFAAANYPGD